MTVYRCAVGVVALACALSAQASDPREPFESETFTPGRVVELTTETTPGLVAHDILLDADEFSDRLYGGAPLRIAAVTRELANERLFVRMPNDPKEKDADRPLRGLLVWINAGRGGGVPEVFTQAADELNLVIVGPENVGNDRSLADRMQVCLDAVATVEAAVPIDTSRVYVTGISGGGRVSSMLHICFPDVFAGSVPIVGVNCYTRISAGNGRGWPAHIDRPRGQLWGLLREQRIAPISGPPDFNHEQTAATVKRFVRDGLDARYFEYPDQEHTLPTSERFGEAIGWVDETWATRRDERTAEAERMVASVEGSLEQTGRETPSAAHRRRLEKALELAPWTDPGDRSRALLGED